MWKSIHGGISRLLKHIFLTILCKYSGNHSSENSTLKSLAIRDLSYCCDYSSRTLCIKILMIRLTWWTVAPTKQATLNWNIFFLSWILLHSIDGLALKFSATLSEDTGQSKFHFDAHVFLVKFVHFKRSWCILLYKKFRNKKRVLSKLVTLHGLIWHI